jgi:Fringe-like
MTTILNRVKNKLSYNASYFLFDKWLTPELSVKKILDKQPKSVLLCILHGKCNKFRTDYLYNYYIRYKQTTDFIFYSDYENIEKHVVKVSNCTTYSSNELKHVNVLNALKKSLKGQFSYILFVDDDTFVNLDLLLHLVNKKCFSNRLIHGEVLKPGGDGVNAIFSKYPGLEYPSGGGGYLVPCQFLSAKKRFKNFRTGFSDVSFGLNFNKEVFYNSDLLKSQNRGFYGIQEKDINKYMTFHYIRTEGEFNKYFMAMTNGEQAHQPASDDIHF